eukprot:9395667-Pyramimonas_sp.AAC.1
MRRVISDECCDALQLFHGNLLADIEKFYDSLQLDCVIEAGLRMDFHPRLLTMMLLQHSATRVLRWKGAFSTPTWADRSLLAGSRHSNNLAKAVVYSVIGRMLENSQALPKPLPRA